MALFMSNCLSFRAKHLLIRATKYTYTKYANKEVHRIAQRGAKTLSLFHIPYVGIELRAQTKMVNSM